MKDLIKFEYLFAFALLVILSISLFVFKNSTEIVTTILTALVAGFSGVLGFFFTKHVPKDGE